MRTPFSHSRAPKCFQLSSQSKPHNIFKAFQHKPQTRQTSICHADYVSYVCLSARNRAIDKFSSPSPSSTPLSHSSRVKATRGEISQIYCRPQTKLNNKNLARKIVDKKKIEDFNFFKRIFLFFSC